MRKGQKGERERREGRRKGMGEGKGKVSGEKGKGESCTTAVVHVCVKCKCFQMFVHTPIAFVVRLCFTKPSRDMNYTRIHFFYS